MEVRYDEFTDDILASASSTVRATRRKVRYDEFTDDILANRLVKAATELRGPVQLPRRGQETLSQTEKYLEKA